ncbi:MAG: hypothetical protein HXY40_17945 [Chloroflexi bacterium]|nr:hypothetical protein [Chloroflexota bacterium]
MSVSAREWRGVLLYALLLALISTLPYLAAWALQTPDTVFSGFLLGTEDGNSYLGKMRIGARGEWHFGIFYTSEQHNSAPLLFLPYIVPGQIIGLLIGRDHPALTEALLLTFHAMRIAFGVLMVLVMYRFIAEFVRAPGLRFTALLLATLGGGFGWLLLLLGGLPPEWYIPEAFSFLIIYGLPHLALARAALLLGLLAVIWLVKGARHDWRLYTLAASCWLLVGLAVPFYLVIVYAILGAWGLAAWQRARKFPTALFWRTVIPAAFTLPLFLYYMLTFTTNPVFAQWSAQNDLPSPSPLHYALAYSVLAPLAFFGARCFLKTRLAPRFEVLTTRMLLVGWVLLVPLLVYLPINVQRRMAEAVIMPLALLAAVGLRLLTRQRRSWLRARAMVAAVLLPSYALLLVGSLVSAAARTPPLFLSAGEVAALRWLETRVNSEDVVLAAFNTCNRIAGRTNARAFAGHGPETLFLREKREDIARFFGGALTLAQLQARYSSQFTLRPITYVFVGPDERALMNGSGDWMAGLTRVYAQDGYEIYTVDHP